MNAQIGRALAPRSTMVHASPRATPEKWTSLSSPIMISSITLHRPSFTASGVSNVDAISPPAPARRCGLQLDTMSGTQLCVNRVLSCRWRSFKTADHRTDVVSAICTMPSK